MWNGIRKHFTLWCFACTGCPLWQTQSWKFPLIKGSSPKKYPKRWRLRERWDLKSYWKGLEAHPKIFFFKCLWLTCLDKENYADCLDMQRLLATSFSFFWVSPWKVAQTQDMAVPWWERTFLIPVFNSSPSMNSMYLEELIKKIPGELFRYELRESLCRYRWWRKKRWSPTEGKNFHPTTHRDASQSKQQKSLSSTNIYNILKPVKHWVVWKSSRKVHWSLASMFQNRGGKAQRGRDIFPGAQLWNARL